MPSITIPSVRPRRHSTAPVEHAHIRFARGTRAPSDVQSNPSPSTSQRHMDLDISSSLPTTHMSRDIRGLRQTHIHHLLAHANDRHGPLIRFDMSLPPPSTVVASHQRGEPATYPPQRSLTIICPTLVWPITVHKKRHDFVSVSDVLEAVYQELRRNASAEEFAYLPLQAQSRASEAYRRRYRRLVDRDQYHAEKSQGLRRVDFLLEHRYWKGLRSTTNGPTIWELSVSES